MTDRNLQLPNEREPQGTPAWRRFFRALAALQPRTGSVTFAGTSSEIVALVPPIAGADYSVLLEVPENRRFWISSKTADAFAVNADGSTSSTIHYVIERR